MRSSPRKKNRVAALPYKIEKSSNWKGSQHVTSHDHNKNNREPWRIGPYLHMLSGKRKHWVQRAGLNGCSTTPLVASLASITVPASDTNPIWSAPIVTISPISALAMGIFLPTTPETKLGMPL